MRAYSYALIESIYAGFVSWCWIIPAISGFLIYYFIPFKFRWIAPTLLTITVILAVKGSAHQFFDFTIGAGIYLVFSALGIFLRCRQNKTGFVKEKGYDILIVPFALAVAWFFYDAPLL